MRSNIVGRALEPDPIARRSIVGQLLEPRTKFAVLVESHVAADKAQVRRSVAQGDAVERRHRMLLALALDIIAHEQEQWAVSILLKDWQFGERNLPVNEAGRIARAETRLDEAR